MSMFAKTCTTEHIDTCEDICIWKLIQKPMSVLQECGNLELVSEPYKLDNARLVKECNDLHMKLLHQTEDSDKKQKGEMLTSIASLL